MKAKEIGWNTFFLLLCYLGSCMVVTAAEALFSFILAKFTEIPYPVLTVIRIVLYSLGVPAILSAVAYAVGYREASFRVGETAIGGLLASLLQFPFAALVHFHAFAAGPVRFAAGLIRFGWDVVAGDLDGTPLSLSAAVFFAYATLFLALLTLFGCAGARRRVADRARLTGIGPDDQADGEQRIAGGT